MKKLTTAVLLMGALSAPVMAGNYAGVQYAMTTYAVDGFDDAEPKALVGIFGKNITDNFAVEGRLGLGMSSDTINFDFGGFNFDGEAEIDNFFSVFAKGSVPMGQAAKFYGLVGLTSGKITTTVTETSTGTSASGSDTETDLSYGVGVEFGGGNTTGTLEYVNYIDKDDYTISAISLGANFKF